MKQHNLKQGDSNWHAYRAGARNASDAAAMLGCHPQKTRNQLLHEKKTGMAREHSQFVQERVFAAGHAVEAKKRAVAEAIIGEDLYPLVGSEELSNEPLSTVGIELSASFDGLTADQTTNWECKSLNDELRAALPNPGPDGNDAANLPKYHRVQMQQQCMVSGCKRVLFTASDGEGDDRHCWFYPDADLAREIIAGWIQFDLDLEAYVPVEVLPPAVAAPTMDLPAVSIKVNGAIALVDNLDVFGVELKAFIKQIPDKPSNDQEFADCKAAITKLQAAQDALDAAESHALAQISSFDDMRRTKTLYWDLARTTRLAVEKLVAARESAIKLEEIQGGKDDFTAHMQWLNTRLGRPYMPAVTTDFPGCIKNKRMVASLKNAIATELARAKIEANAIADKIQINLNVLADKGKDYDFLFNDLGTIVLKANDDFATLVDKRVTDHEVAKLQQEEQTRERIRAEEKAKLEREQAAAAQKLIDDAATATAAAATLAAARDQAVTGTGVIKMTAVLGDADTAPVMLVERVAPANVVSMRTAAPAARVAPSTPPTLKLGQISERLGFTVSGDFLKTLGFEPAARDKSALLFHESSFTLICAALIDHINQVQAQQAA